MHHLNFLVVGGVILLSATAAHAAGGPDLTGIAAIITACVGILGFFATLLKGSKGKNPTRTEEAQQAASYVEGFQALIDALNKEILDNQTEFDEEKQKWTTETAIQQRTIVEVRSELREAKGELSEIKGQIRGYLSPHQYREFLKQMEND